MTDDVPIPDEPDFAEHLRNVLQDCWDHTVGADEAEQAILEHPAIRNALKLVTIGPLDG